MTSVSCKAIYFRALFVLITLMYNLNRSIWYLFSPGYKVMNNDIL